MSARRKSSLWQAIDVIEAQETLTLIRAFSYTNMKQIDRADFDSKLKSTAYPSDIYKTKEDSAVDLKDSFLMKLKGRFSGKR